MLKILDQHYHRNRN